MPTASGNTFQGIHREGGNTMAWEELYAVWFRKLFNYGRKFSPDEGLIEDVIQDIFLTLWQQGSLEVRSPDSYLFTAFRNNLLRKIKLDRGKQLESLSDEYDFHIELSPDQLMIRNERRNENRRKISHALATLTSRQREFIFLKYYQQLSYQEIAEIMDISAKAVYKLAARAIQLLRRELESEQCMLIALVLCSPPPSGNR